MNVQSVSGLRGSVEQGVPRSTVSLAGWGPVHIAGDARLLDRTSIAVVGSRSASHEGRALAAAVASELVRHGLVVLSGLAAGIDKAAHEAAMREGGRTIAVLGTSLDQAYPRHHAGLQERIATEHLLVSPFESGTPTARWHFPKRNRLMAHLARAMVLAEAGCHERDAPSGRSVRVARQARVPPRVALERRDRVAPRRVCADGR